MMKEFKANTVKGILLLLCIAVVSASAVCAILLNGTNGIAFATDSGQGLEQLCQSYTDSDTIEGTLFSIRDYPKNLYHTTARLLDSIIEIQDDDPIIKIVPKQYFIDRGDHIYIGKEYGFFVNTVAQANSSNNIVTVLVFDISTDTDLEETKNRVIVRVEPIFQYCFGYVVANESRVFLPDGATYKTYRGASAEGSIVALPNLADQFNQCEKFYLKDISFGATLFNEQELNVGNEGYQAEYDDGSFITMYDYYYDGIKRDLQGVNTSDTVNLTLSTINTFISFLSLMPIKPINYIFGGLSVLLGVGQIWVYADDIKEKRDGKVQDIYVSNGRITATCLYTTRRDQLAHYVDAETQKPALTKSATILIKGDDNSGNVWYKVGNSAEGYFTLSDSANTTPWYTRYIQEIALSVVDKDGREYVSQAVGSQTYMLYEPVYKTGHIGSNELPFLPQGRNCVSFSPQFTSDYEIAFDKPYDFTVTIVDTQTNQKTNIMPVDGKYKYRFVGGKRYNVEIYSPYGDIVNMTFEPTDNSASQSFDASGQNVFKFVSTENQIVALSSSSDDVVVQGVYRRNQDGMLMPAAESEAFDPCAEAETYMQAGQTYYIVLKNKALYATVASLAIEKCNNVLNTTRIDLEGGANFKYYRFTPSENGDYHITFDNDITDFGDNDAIIYRCFDENVNEISHSAYSYGYLILRNLVANKDYYIGIRSTRTMRVEPTIVKNNVMFCWKMKVNGEFEPVENVLHLKRGNAYEFGLWINGVKAKDYAVENSYSEYFGKISTAPYCGIQIYINALDGSCIRVYAKCEEKTGANWDYGLTVYAEYDTSKVDFAINYDNATMLTIQDQYEAINIIQYDIYLYINGVVEQRTISDKTVNIYNDLIARKAYNNTYFVLKSITVKSASGNGQRKITGLHRRFDIYTLFSRVSIENGETVYHIANGLQFYNIRRSQTNKRVFDNDISLGCFDNWTPIPSLNCDIDGNNHSITNLKLILDAPYLTDKYGLVAYNYATISNLTLSDFAMSYGWEEKNTWMFVGSFAGVNYGTIQNCQAYGSIYGYREFMSVGGIAGQNNGNILSTTYGRQLGTGAESVVYSWGELGGITGQNTGKIQHTRVLNTKIQHRVYGSSRCIGGIAGYDENGEISNCAVEDSIIENINDQTVKSFYPKMGVIVGHKVNGKITSVGARNVRTSTGNLYKNNKAYCFNGSWPFYGLMENCTVDGNPGQYGP